MGRKLHFPTDIKLKNNPIVEAWLELRWNLQTGDAPNILLDPLYPFALGVFYNSVKDQFKETEVLPASSMPDGFLPYLVQRRFRAEKDGWPLLQLGPGIATVNFAKSYSWTEFKEKALYLREKVINAYQPNKLGTNALILHYRNSHLFEYSVNNTFEFLENLNTHIHLPSNIPGSAISSEFPSQSKILFQFNLNEPKGIGQIQIGSGITGNNLDKNDEIIIWELEVGSVTPDVPDLADQSGFSTWLENAHSILHEWFFSMIDGKLYKEFSE